MAKSSRVGPVAQKTDMPAPENIELEMPADIVRSWFRFYNAILLTVWLGMLCMAVYIAYGVDENTPGDFWPMILLLVPIVTAIPGGIWYLLRAGSRNPGGIRRVQFTDTHVVFHHRDSGKSPERFPYLVLLGAIAAYRSSHSSYDSLELRLPNIVDMSVVSDFGAKGEDVEKVAEALRRRIRAARGDCVGGWEYDREYRRKQRTALFRKTKTKLLLTIVPLVFLGCVMALEYGAWRENRLSRTGVRITGILEKTDYEKSNCHVRYVFRDDSEMRHEGKGTIKAKAGRELLLNGPIDILYLADDPGYNLPVGFIPEAPIGARVLFWAIALFFLMGPFMIFTGREIALVRGRVAWLHKGELEEEWLERTRADAG